MGKENIYKKFCELFPDFKPQVKRYFKYDDGIKVYTKQGGSFFFRLTDDSFELKAIDK